MSRTLTMNAAIRFLPLVSIFLFALIVVQPAHAEKLTQRDWMVTIVDAMGWSYGLPDEPQDPDYINILTGNRTFRFEAEDIFGDGIDNVSVMSFRNFGSFSGRGWLNGTRTPTDVHLKITLPIAGEYQLHAQLRQPGHLFNVEDTTIAAEGSQLFTRVAIGTFQLQAGEQEIVVTLPANGSLDYIDLEAPNQRKITPLDGWQPDQPLQWEVIQTTLLQILQLADIFPPSAESLTIEAESLDQQHVDTVSIPHLGRPSGGKWLRSGPVADEVRFPIILEEGGFYDLVLRVMGSKMSMMVGDRELQLQTKPYLDDFSFETLFFFAGKSFINLSLPPGGGVDLLSLTRRQIDDRTTATLLGLEMQNNPEASDLNFLALTMTAFGAER